MTEQRSFANIVDGHEQGAAAVMDVVDPATGGVYAVAPNSDAHDVDLAFQAAARAFESWRWTTPAERQRALLRLADLVEDNAEELVEVESQDTGKPVSLTMTEEIPMMLEQIRFFAGAARVLEGRASAEYLRGHTSSIRREPIGPVGQVAPWNYPMMMAVWKFAPESVLTDTIYSLGLMICFYYGLTAFGCVWFFRHELLDSASAVVLKLVFPLLGGLGLFAVFLVTLRDSASPDYGSGASIGGVGLVLILGLGLIVLGVVLMLLQRARDGAFFRGETLTAHTEALVVPEP